MGRTRGAPEVGKIDFNSWKCTECGSLGLEVVEAQVDGPGPVLYIQGAEPVE